MPVKNSATRLIAQNAGSGKPTSAAVTVNTVASTTLKLGVKEQPVSYNDTQLFFTDIEKEGINIKDEGKQKRKPPVGTSAGSRQRSAGLQSMSDNIGTGQRLGSGAGTSIVYTFSPTDYDTYLTGSGINSYQPVIIADIPFINYFGSESPSYDIVKIQQDLQDTTIKTANNLVSEFYRTNSSKQRSLAQIRDKNLAFYNAAVPALTKVTGAARSLLIVLSSNTPAIEDYRVVRDSTIGSQRYNGVSVPSSSGVYDDDDIIKNTIFNVTSGYSSERADGKLYTATLLGQQARDRLGELIYGTFTTASTITAEDRAVGAAEGDRASPSTITNEAASTSRSFGVYKHVLTRAAIAWQKGGFISDADFREFNSPDDDDYDDGLDVNDLYSDGTYALSDVYTNGVTEAISGYDSEDNPNKPYGVRGVVPKFESSVQDRPGTRNYSSKIPILITAHLINEQLGGPMSNSTTLPSFLRYIGTGPSSFTIQQTATEGKLPLVAQIGSKTYSLFDTIIPNDDINTNSGTHGLLAATTFDIDELTTLRNKISESRSALDKVISQNTGYLSNKTAVFLLRCMFEEYYSFFNSSVLTTADSRFSLARTILFLRAAGDEDQRGKVWAMCNNKRNIREAQDLTDFEEAIQSSISGFGFMTTDKEYSNPGVFTFDSYGDTVQESAEEAAEKRDTSRKFLESVFGSDSSFGMFDRIADRVIRLYPEINNTMTEGAIKLTSFLVFMDILKLIKAKYKLSFTQEYESKNYNGVKGYIKFSKRDTAAITDCLRSALTSSELTNFSTYTALQDGIYESTKESIRSHFWSRIRGIVNDVLSPYESFIDVMAYTRSLLSKSLLAVDQAVTAYTTIKNAYTQLDGATDAQAKSKLLISKYGTPEVIAELRQRDQRYKNLIKGTDITSMAARSGYFRSVVEAAHRDVLTERQAKIYVVGLPYGMMESLRLTKPVEQTIGPKFNVHINKIDDSGNLQRVDYYLPQDTLSSSNDGFAYNSGATQIADIQETTRFTNFADPNIIVDFFSPSVATMIPSQANPTRTAGYESQKIQSTLETFVEDLYGLYPRYAFTKSLPQRTAAEEEIATEVANTFAVDDQEAQLIRTRLKAAIMMHKDFCTTTMLNDLETSPLFDKIVYCLVETETVGNLASLTAKVQV